MAAKPLKGAPVAKAITEACARDIAALCGKGTVPRLAIVRVGAREDDLAYERGIARLFTSAGASAEVHKLPGDAWQCALERVVASLNDDPRVHGVLLFRPLPGHLSEERIKGLIMPSKDIDCMSHANAAAVFEGDASGHPPCTPKAVMELLSFYGIALAGKKVAVVGRSLVVGRPLAMMLMSQDATVTLCHTKTRDLAGECRRSDIIVCCAGKPRMLGADAVRPGQVVIDVGINMSGGKLCGDADYDAAQGVVDAITPVPGGVGAVTASILLMNTVRSAAACSSGHWEPPACSSE